MASRWISCTLHKLLDATRIKLDAEEAKLSRLKAEIIKVVMGESHFTSELLTEQIANVEQGIAIIQDRVEALEKAIESKNVEQEEAKILKAHIPNWRNVFERASTAKKKMMLSTIINKIVVKREGIKIDFKLRISQFIGTMGAADENRVNSRKVLTDIANVISV